jgi:hypothetical protein
MHNAYRGSGNDLMTGGFSSHSHSLPCPEAGPSGIFYTALARSLYPSLYPCK